MTARAPAPICYVSLLRGINVGGKNLIRMSELKACFVRHGLVDATTYIQSGNVVFSSPERMEAALARRIEEMLSKAFAYDASVVLRSRDDIARIVRGAPEGFGSQPDEFRYDVIFLRAPLTAERALEHASTREGVDRAYTGDDVLYFSRLISRASESRLSKLVSDPVYKSTTIRNWNTTTKLLELMESRA